RASPIHGGPLMARRSKILIIGLPMAALVAAAGAAVSITRSQPQELTLAPVISPPVQPGAGASANGSVMRGYIGAAGLIESNGQEIEIGSHASGIVAKVLVNPGDKV